MSAAALTDALPLGEWQNFYVIVGSSAGALIGLTFIVITLAADASGLASTASARLSGLRAFITPTAVHFGAALWVAALLSVPGQTAFTLALCLAGSGLAGTVYCALVVHWMLRTRSASYKPFVSDWIWSTILPLCAYVALLATALLLHARAAASLYIVAAAALLLLLIGIHNAWDVVVWITTERHAHRERQRHADHLPQESSASKPSPDG